MRALHSRNAVLDVEFRKGPAYMPVDSKNAPLGGKFKHRWHYVGD